MIYCIDEYTGYTYHVNYCGDYISPERSRLAIREVIKHDFIFNMIRFLVGRLSVEGNTAHAIASSLHALMADASRHYHTPYHILNMFLFAKEHDIGLSDWEHLAIWFHDASYVSLAPHDFNEHQSVSFMRAVLPHGYCLSDNSIVNQADRAILHTAKHLDPEMPKDYELLLDLDISIFAAKPSIFDKAALCVRTEFCNQGGTLRRFEAGRRKFLERLLAKQYIFRTPQFRQKHEQMAKANATRAQKQLSR